jgi:hypothetical protein
MSGAVMVFNFDSRLSLALHAGSPQSGQIGNT